MSEQPSILSGLISKAVLEVEGQIIQIPLDIAQSDDDTIRRALVTAFPGAANAKIEREEDGDTLKIKVIKRFGTKGNILSLIDVPSGRNAAVEMYLVMLEKEGGELSPEDMIPYQKLISEAIEQGTKERDALSSALGRLQAAQSIPAPFVVLGF